MEGLETAFNVLLLMIQVLNFAPSRLLFPVLFNGSGASLSHAIPSHPFRSFHHCLSVFRSPPLDVVGRRRGGLLVTWRARRAPRHQAATRAASGGPDAVVTGELVRR